MALQTSINSIAGATPVIAADTISLIKSKVSLCQATEVSLVHKESRCLGEYPQRGSRLPKTGTKEPVSIVKKGRAAPDIDDAATRC